MNKPYNILDSEISDDIKTIASCPDCNSFNVSVDISTNKITCNNCKDRIPKDALKKDISVLNDEILSKEHADMEEAIKKGTKFNI